jgi:hypothetical protein
MLPAFPVMSCLTSDGAVVWVTWSILKIPTYGRAYGVMAQSRLPYGIRLDHGDIRIR